MSTANLFCGQEAMNHNMLPKYSITSLTYVAKYKKPHVVRIKNLCSVFIVCVVLYSVFRLIVVLFCVMCVICVLCFMVAPLPLGKNPSAVKINNNK
jgi:hypothetical protein